MKKTFLASLFAFTALSTVPASAHFLLVYTPETALEKGGEITLKMPFTHPAESGHVMEMVEPEEFFVIKKGKKTDLKDKLSVIDWTSAENTNTAYEATVRLKGLGDNVFVVQPAPYFEGSEDIYIQQITKSYVNVGELPTDWDQPQGLKTEIVPLIAPYAAVAGSTFSGVVLSEGEPVPYAEIEVEYMNFEPNLETNSFAKDGAWESTPAFSIRADAAGAFTFGLPKAGHWGFAALGTGPDTEFEGKELSQDAVIWIQANELK
ncbi:DUF4198 domain-containing protein [Kiloniella sp. b19]|uniref:DUF4198 domain-containing protein n=1 Tax=Kiloniella sp. GXU_MW_B19 TaxID=3141326 RepID=UPI0031CFE998